MSDSRKYLSRTLYVIFKQISKCLEISCEQDSAKLIMVFRMFQVFTHNPPPPKMVHSPGSAALPRSAAPPRWETAARRLRFRGPTGVQTRPMKAPQWILDYRIMCHKLLTWIIKDTNICECLGFGKLIILLVFPSLLLFLLEKSFSKSILYMHVCESLNLHVNKIILISIMLLVFQLIVFWPIR